MLGISDEALGGHLLTFFIFTYMKNKIKSFGIAILFVIFPAISFSGAKAMEKASNFSTIERVSYDIKDFFS